MDFVFDALSTALRIKCLTVVDDFTKESVGILVEHSISSFRVTRALDEMARFRGYPKALRTDQGPEFIGKALDQWAYQRDIKVKLIQPGKLTQNAFIESFSGKFRDESLNEHWFCSLAEARIRIALGGGTTMSTDRIAPLVISPRQNLLHAGEPACTN